MSLLLSQYLNLHVFYEHVSFGHVCIHYKIVPTKIEDNNVIITFIFMTRNDITFHLFKWYKKKPNY